MFVLAIAGLAACSSSEREYELKEESQGDSFQPMLNETGPSGNQSGSILNQEPSSAPPGGVISSMAAEILEGDTARKLIRTAELQFRVKDVADATVRIEEITRQNKGFVVRTQLQSHVSHTTTTPLSADSVLESAHYTVNSRIIIRLPAERLDSTLRALAGLIDFLDYRHINVRDVELELKANQLKQKRHRTAAAPRPRRTAKAQEESGEKGVAETTSPFTVGVLASTPTQSGQTDAREQQLRFLTRADEAELANLTLEDQIRYSTITLNIYQRNDIRRTVLADERNIKEYRPGPGARIGESFITGWGVLITIVEFLAKLWGVFLLGAIAYSGVLIYRRFYVNKGKE